MTRGSVWCSRRTSKLMIESRIWNKIMSVASGRGRGAAPCFARIQSVAFHLPVAAAAAAAAVHNCREGVDPGLSSLSCRHSHGCWCFCWGSWSLWCPRHSLLWSLSCSNLKTYHQYSWLSRYLQLWSCTLLVDEDHFSNLAFVQFLAKGGEVSFLIFLLSPQKSLHLRWMQTPMSLFF